MNKRIDELTSIYLQYRNELFACALAVTKRPDLAEDAVHDAFVRLYRNHQSIHVVDGYLKAYVYRSVRNAAIDLMRTRPNVSALNHNELFDAADSPVKLAQHGEFQERVSNLLLSMQQTEREVIIQRLYADLTFQEIADAMESPIGTVTSWYHRGIQRLRKKLKVHDE